MKENDREAPFPEHEWLTWCALRFDFHGYCATLDFAEEAFVAEALDAALNGRIDELTQAQRLAAFFVLQRKLFKWGWDRLPEHSAPWNTFRSLFLALCRVEIPEAHRLQPYHDDWQARFAPGLDAAVAQVQRIHGAKRYEPWTGDE